MNVRNIYYLTQPDSANEPVYNRDGNLLGHYTGFMTRPTVHKEGTIQIKPAGILSEYKDSSMWVYGDAVFIPGIGFKFVYDFTAEYVNF